MLEGTCSLFTYPGTMRSTEYITVYCAARSSRRTSPSTRAGLEDDQVGRSPTYTRVPLASRVPSAASAAGSSVLAPSRLPLELPPSTRSKPADSARIRPQVARTWAAASEIAKSPQSIGTSLTPKARSWGGWRRRLCAC